MSRTIRVKYYVEQDAAALAQHAARYFVEMVGEAVEGRGRARIAISGGTTPKATFQLTREALLDHVPLTPDQIHRIEGELDPLEAADEYESELRESFRLEGAHIPRFDLVALGMGPDGHTASLFPQTAALHETNRIVVANHVPQKDTWRVTLTWPVINAARSVFFLIAGQDKAQVLHEVLTGPRDVERLPSQLIRPSSGILTLILDKAAASLLPPTDAEGCGFFEREQ